MWIYKRFKTQNCTIRTELLEENVFPGSFEKDYCQKIHMGHRRLQRVREDPGEEREDQEEDGGSQENAKVAPDEEDDGSVQRHGGGGGDKGVCRSSLTQR